jgi:hypothetical protein
MRKSSDRLRYKEVSGVSDRGEGASGRQVEQNVADCLGLCDVDKEYERHARQQTANARKANDKKRKKN